MFMAGEDPFTGSSFREPLVPVNEPKSRHLKFRYRTGRQFPGIESVGETAVMIAKDKNQGSTIVVKSETEISQDLFKGVSCHRSVYDIAQDNERASRVVL